MDETSKMLTPTVDFKEMSHYKHLSKSWWDKTGEMYGLSYLNQLRIPWVIEKLVETNIISEDTAKSSKPLRGLNILDVGCGGGYATEALAELGCTVVGLDPCTEVIEAARAHQMGKSSLTTATYVCGTIEEHCTNNSEKYDAVFASEVLDHVYEQDLFLELCVKCLKPGGSMFVTTFNNTWSAWFLYIVVYEYITGTIPFGTHTTDKFISPENVAKIIKKYNCQTKSVNGFYYNCFTKKWNWATFISLSYALHAVKGEK